MTSVAFQSILRKQIRKLPKILKSDSVKMIHYYSLFFIRVLSEVPALPEQEAPLPPEAALPLPPDGRAEEAA